MMDTPAAAEIKRMGQRLCADHVAPFHEKEFFVELDKLIAAASAEQLKADCAALCPYCANGLPVYKDHSTGGYPLRHTVDNGSFGKSGEPCYAVRLRDAYAAAHGSELT